MLIASMRINTLIFGSLILVAVISYARIGVGFCTYKSYNRAIILMGNDVACKTIGIDTIKLKMFDWKVLTLTNMSHIPHIGALEVAGCKFSGDGTISR